MSRPFRMRRPVGRPALVAVLVAILALVRLLFNGAEEAPPEALEEAPYRVRHVIDGDTLRLADGSRVRLQGIDAPEVGRDGEPSEPFSRRATEFAERFVDDAGGEVLLTFGAERMDRYGRHLAFVWDGDAMLNEELVRNGLAEARPDYRFSGRMKRRLLAAQDEAREAGLGIWSRQ